MTNTNKNFLDDVTGVCPALRKLADVLAEANTADRRRLFARLHDTETVHPRALMRRHARCLKLVEDLRALFNDESVALLRPVWPKLFRENAPIPTGYRWLTKAADRAAGLAQVARYAPALGTGERGLWIEADSLIAQALQDMAPVPDPLQTVRVVHTTNYDFVFVEGNRRLFGHAKNYLTK